MQDLEIAKRRLYDKDLTLVIVKKVEVVFETNSQKISGFVSAIEMFDTQLKGASVADRVAGKALALLCVYAGIREVYAELLSKKAEAVLVANEIPFEFKDMIDNVLDANKKDICPFEKISDSVSDPKEAYSAFKTFLEKMKPCR
jgi:hypothetical protein